jgi:hypothetical protein
VLLIMTKNWKKQFGAWTATALVLFALYGMAYLSMVRPIGAELIMGDGLPSGMLLPTEPRPEYVWKGHRAVPQRAWRIVFAPAWHVDRLVRHLR